MPHVELKRRLEEGRLRTVRLPPSESERLRVVHGRIEGLVERFPGEECDL